jgi:hypothetical protein
VVVAAGCSGRSLRRRSSQCTPAANGRDSTSLGDRAVGHRGARISFLVSTSVFRASCGSPSSECAKTIASAPWCLLPRRSPRIRLVQRATFPQRSGARWVFARCAARGCGGAE